MADAYRGKKISSRAIYPTRFVPHLIILAVAKFGRAFGIFLTYDLLKVIHIVQFLFLVMTGTGAVLVVLQKPFSSGERLSKRQLFRIFRHAFVGCLIKLVWLLGLTLCGPLRSILLYDHSDMVVIAGASALFASGGSPAKFRGAVFWILGVLGILLFDHDDLKEHVGEAPGLHGHSGVLTHLFDHMTDLTGLSDHKGGVMLMLFALCMTVGFNNAAKKLSLDVGGAKRLNALSTLASSILLAPWALFVFATKESLVESWFWMMIPILLIIGAVFVFDYYVELVCITKLESHATYHFGAIAVFISGLLLSCFWTYPFSSLVASTTQTLRITAEEHVLSGGVIFSLILFIFATNLLTSQTRGSSRGSFIGYSSTGLPLYSFTEQSLQKGQSVLSFARKGLKQVLEESDSRKIFYFLCINLVFTFVELTYGVWTNSLGLISDGFHMFFDCSALVMGLYAALMSRWKATRIYSYGYDRVEILSGFINALFLMVIALFVFCAAMSRIYDPPDIKTERLLVVSVLGFLVNMIGIFAFQHGHSHGGGSHGHSHGGGSHSHGSSHGHSHGGSHGHGSNLNTNMQGVFLHVLADTMGSVGVIISTLLIENFGWKVADPICSLFIAILIFASVVPLVGQTCSILLLRTPEELEPQIDQTLQNILSIKGVERFQNVHIWRHSSTVVCGTLSVLVGPEVSEQQITSQVTLMLREVGVKDIAVQVEKSTFYQHMSGLGRTAQPFTDSTLLTPQTTLLNRQNFIKAI